MIETYMRSNRGTQEQTLKVVELTDHHVFEPLKQCDPDKYWHIMRKIHEIYNGCHYNEDFAMWQVEQMSHVEKSGIIRKGAHWTMNQVSELFAKYKSRLKPTDTLADLYVAVHSWWHDNICQDTTDFGDAAEAKNIERGIIYFFGDEDAPEGKIWRYYRGMSSHVE